MLPYDPIGTVQQAIAALLTQHGPQFLAIGIRMFTASPQSSSCGTASE